MGNIKKIIALSLTLLICSTPIASFAQGVGLRESEQYSEVVVLDEFDKGAKDPVYPEMQTDDYKQTTAEIYMADLPFTDVKKGKWYYNAVEYAYNNKLFAGTTANTFAPDLAVTRSMFVTVLARKCSNYSEGAFKKKYSYYDDVRTSDWYNPAVRWASDAGLVNGTDFTEFSPNKSISREEMAVMLYNYAKAAGNTLKVTNGVEKKYSDFSKVSSWARTAIKWALSNKVISGVGGNRIDPKGQATRAQVAQIFKNVHSLLLKNQVKSEGNPPTRANMHMLMDMYYNALVYQMAGTKPDIGNGSYDLHYSRKWYCKVTDASTVEEVERRLSNVFSGELVRKIMAKAQFAYLNGELYISYPPTGGMYFTADSLLFDDGYILFRSFEYRNILDTRALPIMQLEGVWKITGLPTKN